MSLFNAAYAESHRRRQRALFLDEVLDFVVRHDESRRGVTLSDGEVRALAAEILIEFDEDDAIRYDIEDGFMAISEEY